MALGGLVWLELLLLLQDSQVVSTFLYYVKVAMVSGLLGMIVKGDRFGLRRASCCS